MYAAMQVGTAWLLNAVWAPAVLYGAAVLLLKCGAGLAARQRFAFWMGAVALAALAPAGALLPLWMPGVAPQAVAGLVETEALPVAGVLAGVLVVVGLGRLGWRMASTVRLAAGARSAELPLELAELVPAGARVLVSEGEAALLGPVTYGWPKPVILIPGALFEAGREEALRAALAHELGHVERRDALWQMVAEVLLAPVWWHPASGAMRRRLEESRELACDEQVVSRYYAEAAEYGRSLLEVAREVLALRTSGYALGVVDGGILAERLQRLARYEAAPGRRALGYALAAVLCVLTGALLGPSSWAYAVTTPKVVKGMTRAPLLPPPPPPPPPPPAN